MPSLSYFLDTEGRIQSSASYNLVEGEVVQDLTKEQVAEMLGVDVENIYAHYDVASGSEAGATS